MLDEVAGIKTCKFKTADRKASNCIRSRDTSMKSVLRKPTFLFLIHLPFSASDFQKISQPKFCISFLLVPSSELCIRSVHTNFELAFIVYSIRPYLISLRSEYFFFTFGFQVLSSKSSACNEVSYQQIMKISICLTKSILTPFTSLDFCISCKNS
jgi:hypothetical protein